MGQDAGRCSRWAASRRHIIKSGISLGVALALPPRLTLAQAGPTTVRPRVGDLMVRDGDPTATPLGPRDIPIDAEPIRAWSVDPADGTVRNGTRLNAVMLLRFDPAQLAAETRARAAEGVVGYTVICTHEGCDVTDWIAAEHAVQCGCHFTKFDARDGARVLEGPAPRALPALPLAVVDGKLTVARPFTDRVGFEVA